MVREWIIDWFNENKKTENEIDCNSNYIDSEIIDSIAFVTLIADCEDQFEIAFDDADFEGQEMFTVNGLISLIERKLGN